MSDPELEAITRAARRRDRVPPSASCAACGTDRHLSALSGGRVLCYEDRQTERGVSPIEVDHVAGRANLGGLVASLRANDHRTVTDLRQCWGVDGWPTASDDPLVLLAHLLAGVASILVLVAEWLVTEAVAAERRLGHHALAGARAFPVVA